MSMLFGQTMTASAKELAAAPVSVATPSIAELLTGEGMVSKEGQLAEQNTGVGTGGSDGPGAGLGATGKERSEFAVSIDGGTAGSDETGTPGFGQGGSAGITLSDAIAGTDSGRDAGTIDPADIFPGFVSTEEGRQQQLRDGQPGSSGGGAASGGTGGSGESAAGSGGSGAGAGGSLDERLSDQLGLHQQKDEAAALGAAPSAQDGGGESVRGATGNAIGVRDGEVTTHLKPAGELGNALVEGFTRESSRNGAEFLKEDKTLFAGKPETFTSADGTVTTTRYGDDIVVVENRDNGTRTTLDKRDNSTTTEVLTSGKTTSNSVKDQIGGEDQLLSVAEKQAIRELLGGDQLRIPDGFSQSGNDVDPADGDGSPALVGGTGIALDSQPDSRISQPGLEGDLGGIGRAPSGPQPADGGAIDPTEENDGPRAPGRQDDPLDNGPAVEPLLGQGSADDSRSDGQSNSDRPASLAGIETPAVLEAPVRQEDSNDALHVGRTDDFVAGSEADTSGKGEPNGIAGTTAQLDEFLAQLSELTRTADPRPGDGDLADLAELASPKEQSSGSDEQSGGGDTQPMLGLAFAELDSVAGAPVLPIEDLGL